DRLHPENPTFASEAERLVWERLRDTLPGDAILLANQRLTDEHKDHEADLIVLWPEVGCLVLEVKGGSVWRDGDQWWQSGKGQRVIAPVDQARDAKYAFRDFVQTDPRWARGGLVWAHGVVTPYSAFDEDFAAPDCPRWALHDRDDLENLAERVRGNAQHMAQGKRVPTHDDIEMVSEILRGRSFTSRDRNAEAAERQSVADRLSQEQAAILRVTRLLNRVEIRGGAGSGKTVLALTQARELSTGRDGQPPQRVALLCYSYGLAYFLQRQTESWPRRQRPAFVGTYEDFARELGVTDFGARDESDFWEQQLPPLMASLAEDLPVEKRYDAFVVDESQDFADEWWTPVLRSMADPERSGLYAYSDEHQRIFARFGQPPVPL
ncbi:MAG: nuclease, partial [Myxococcales bacterium]